MSSPETSRDPSDGAPKVTESPHPDKVDLPTPPTNPDERERLRDILVVIIAYPLTPTSRADEVGRSKPWLEVLSLVLKAALAAYAIYKGGGDGGW